MFLIPFVDIPNICYHHRCGKCVVFCRRDHNWQVTISHQCFLWLFIEVARKKRLSLLLPNYIIYNSLLIDFILFYVVSHLWNSNYEKNILICYIFSQGMCGQAIVFLRYIMTREQLFSNIVHRWAVFALIRKTHLQKMLFFLSGC